MWSRGTHCRSTWRPLGGRIMVVEQWEAGEVTAVWCPEVEVQRWWRSTWCGRHDKLKNDCVTKLMTRVRGGRKRTNNGDKQQRMMWRDNQEEMKVIDVQRKQRGRGTAHASGSVFFFFFFFKSRSFTESILLESHRHSSWPQGQWPALVQKYYKVVLQCDVDWSDASERCLSHIRQRWNSRVVYFSLCDEMLLRQVPDSLLNFIFPSTKAQLNSWFWNQQERKIKSRSLS